MITVDIPNKVKVSIVESVDDNIKSLDDVAIINLTYDKEQPTENTKRLIKQLQALNKLIRIKPKFALEYSFNHGIVPFELINKRYIYLVLVDNTEDNKQWAFEYKKLLLNIFSAFKEDLLILSVPVVDKEENQRLNDKEQRLFETFFKSSI